MVFFYPNKDLYAIKNTLLVFLLLSSFKVFAFDWVAYGDIRGHIEPCGCDPQTDLGGVLRLSNLLQKSVQTIQIY